MRPFIFKQLFDAINFRANSFINFHIIWNVQLMLVLLFRWIPDDRGKFTFVTLSGPICRLDGDGANCKVRSVRLCGACSALNVRDEPKGWGLMIQTSPNTTWKASITSYQSRFWLFTVPGTTSVFIRLFFIQNFV